MHRYVSKLIESLNAEVNAEEASRGQLEDWAHERLDTLQRFFYEQHLLFVFDESSYNELVQGLNVFRKNLMNVAANFEDAEEREDKRNLIPVLLSADSLREFRKRNNLTQQRLAYLLHVSIITIRRWEAGSIPSELNQVAITRLLRSHA
jgi:DNA-binding transcriptional regulator YiaG